MASLDATGYNLVFDPRRNSYGGSFCFIARQTKQDFRSLDAAAQRTFCSCFLIGQAFYVLPSHWSTALFRLFLYLFFIASLDGSPLKRVHNFLSSLLGRSPVLRTQRAKTN